MALTKAERNGLMESLLTGGLKAGDCTLSELKERLTSKLVPTYQIMHKPTGSQFDLYGPVGDFCWQGRMQTGTGLWAHWTARDWDHALVTAQRRATDTAEYAATPDLWALGNAPLPDAADNSPFTPGRTRRDRQAAGRDPRLRARAVRVAGQAARRYRPVPSRS